LPPSLAALIDGTLVGSNASLVQVVRMNEKPYLDGRVLEPVWDDAALVDRPDGERLAVGFDDEYLFLVYQTPRVQQPARKRIAGALRRDAALLGSERLALVIDVDGDALSSLRFEVDPFGRCRETLTGDASFDPTWHAAATTQGNSWTVEIAIPRTSTWAGKKEAPIVSALGVYRIVPGEGTFDVLTGELADDSSLPVRRTLWLDGGPMGTAAEVAELPAEEPSAAASGETLSDGAASVPSTTALPNASLQFDAAPNESLRPTRLPKMR
jgi:hypothetical protein